MNAAIFRYVLSAAVALAADIMAGMLAPVAALPIFITTDTNGRQQVRSGWRWITTHDAPVDEYFMGSYFMRGRVLARYTRDQIRNSAFLSYVGRILWIWRNPAYQVAHWLGYDQRGMKLLYIRDEGSKWDKGEGNFSFWLVRNDRGQIGWMLQWQWFWWGPRCLEVYLGWKLFRTDPDQKCMVAARFTPFKKYEKQPA